MSDDEFPVTINGPVMATAEQRALWAERLALRVTALRVEVEQLATAAASHRTEDGDQIARAARGAAERLAAVDPTARRVEPPAAPPFAAELEATSPPHEQ